MNKTTPDDSKGTPFFRFKCPRTDCGITDSEPGRCLRHGATLVDSWQKPSVAEKVARDPDDTTL